VTGTAELADQVTSSPRLSHAGHGSDTPRFRIARWQIPDAVFIIVMLLALAVATAITLKLQPSGLLTPPWSPASGIALGLGICFRRRYTWMLALAVAAVSLPILVWLGRPTPLAAALIAALAVEMIVGTLLLRGRQDRRPKLFTPSDLARFLAIALVSATLYGVLASAAFYLLGYPAGAVETLQTGVLKHVAGMALLTPLLMAPTYRIQRAGYAETVGHVIWTLGTATGVFIFDDTLLPLAFLTFPSLVAAALRLSTLQLSLVLIGVASIASHGSVNGLGPFAFDQLGGPTGVALLQAYQLSIVAVLLTLSLLVGSEREMSSRLHESEELFRKSFNSSVAGKLMGVRTDDQWIVERANPSARALLPGLQGGIRSLDTLMGRDAVDKLSQATDSLVDDSARITVQLDDGRSLDVSIAVIGETPKGTQFVVHFHDVTESERLRQLELEEMNRAAEVQRALLPGKLPETPGWTFGTSTSPAKQIGGDFYDVRVHQPSIVLSLGDVMGKGMDAGMLAAATRTALRSNDPGMTPSAVVTRAAGILEGDLRRISAFVTLAYVQVDIDSGDFRFADAGHGLHYVLRTKSGRVERLSSDDMPVGLGDQWRELSGRLAPGDMILLVSDGVLDLWGGSLDGLENAITQCANGTGTGPQEVVDYLCANAGELLDGDDVTAVALRRAG
jgi:integral membrane sensor domain MASE1